jgi:predicted metal-dependent hydrolase
MNVNYNTIQIKDQTSRWGSCSSKGGLNFSWRLIKAPAEVLQYVVIHELAHRKHLDHSKNFWVMVEKFDPFFREHRRWLRRHQQDLH